MNKLTRLSVAALFMTGVCASSTVWASLIPIETRGAFEKPAGGELPVEVLPAGDETPVPIAMTARAAARQTIEPSRLAGGDQRSFFNEFVLAALGPLGKSELAQNIHAIGANLKPYLESQGAYTPSSTARDLPPLSEPGAALMPQEFNYFGTLSSTKIEVMSEDVRSETKAIDQVLIERGNVSAPNPIILGAIRFIDWLFKGLAKVTAG